MYKRLISGIESPHQRMDAMCSLLIYWAATNAFVDASNSFPFQLNADIRPLIQYDAELSAFLSLFIMILRECACNIEAPGFHRESDIVVFLCKQLLSRGTVELDLGNGMMVHLLHFQYVYISCM